MSDPRLVKAWHFTRDTLLNGAPIPAIGEWLIHNGEVQMCQSGLHASRRLLDAASFAPAGILHRVECMEIVEEDSDKLVCRRRRIIATLPAARTDQILRRFARRCAYTVIDKWDAPEIVRRWLEAGDDSIRIDASVAAWDVAVAAWDVAGGDARSIAAWSAAWASVWDAAWDAARDAASVAARATAWGAGSVAAQHAASIAAWDAYNGELEEIVLTEMGM